MNYELENREQGTEKAEVKAWHTDNADETDLHGKSKSENRKQGTEKATAKAIVHG